VSAASTGEILEAARQVAGITNRDLWIRYYAIGGRARPEVLDGYLDSSVVADPAEYDVVAQALNDLFTDRGGNHPVPYAEDLDP
jgi:hypothetical protein